MQGGHVFQQSVQCPASYSPWDRVRQPTVDSGYVSCAESGVLEYGSQGRELRYRSP